MALTFAEQVLAREVLNSAVDHGRIHVQYDMEQGVFTPGIVADLLTRAANPGHANMSANIYALVGQIQADGNIVSAPIPFTVDELALMNTILQHHVYFTLHGLDGAGELVQSAEYVGFWSESQLVKLQAQTLHIEQTAVDAINALVADEMAGGQVIGICP